MLAVAGAPQNAFEFIQVDLAVMGEQESRLRVRAELTVRRHMHDGVGVQRQAAAKTRRLEGLVEQFGAGQKCCDVVDFSLDAGKRRKPLHGLRKSGNQHPGCDRSQRTRIRQRQARRGGHGETLDQELPAVAQRRQGNGAQCAVRNEDQGLDAGTLEVGQCRAHHPVVQLARVFQVLAGHAFFQCLAHRAGLGFEPLRPDRAGILAQAVRVGHQNGQPVWQDDRIDRCGMRRQGVDAAGLGLERGNTVVLEVVLQFGALERLHGPARLQQVGLCGVRLGGTLRTPDQQVCHAEIDRAGLGAEVARAAGGQVRADAFQRAGRDAVGRQRGVFVAKLAQQPARLPFPAVQALHRVGLQRRTRRLARQVQRQHRVIGRFGHGALVAQGVTQHALVTDLPRGGRSRVEIPCGLSARGPRRTGGIRCVAAQPPDADQRHGSNMRRRQHAHQLLRAVQRLQPVAGGQGQARQIDGRCGLQRRVAAGAGASHALPVQFGGPRGVARVGFEPRQVVGTLRGHVLVAAIAPQGDGLFQRHAGPGGLARQQQGAAQRRGDRPQQGLVSARRRQLARALQALRRQRRTPQREVGARRAELRPRTGAGVAGRLRLPKCLVPMAEGGFETAGLVLPRSSVQFTGSIGMRTERRAQQQQHQHQRRPEKRPRRRNTAPMVNRCHSGHPV